MKSHRIVFKLTTYQLACGLQAIRQLEPTYQLTSLNEMVKSIYHTYMTKMIINKLDVVPTHIQAEIEHFINNPLRNQITLDELIEIQKQSPVKTSLED